MTDQKKARLKGARWLGKVCQETLSRAFGQKFLYRFPLVIAEPSGLLEYGVCLDGTSFGGRQVQAYVTPWVTPGKDVTFGQLARREFQIDPEVLEAIGSTGPNAEVEKDVNEWFGETALPFLSTRRVFGSYRVQLLAELNTPPDRTSLIPYEYSLLWYELSFSVLTGVGGAETEPSVLVQKLGEGNQYCVENIRNVQALFDALCQSRDCGLSHLRQCLAARLRARKLDEYLDAVWSHVK